MFLFVLIFKCSFCSLQLLGFLLYSTSFCMISLLCIMFYIHTLLCINKLKSFHFQSNTLCHTHPFYYISKTKVDPLKDIIHNLLSQFHQLFKFVLPHSHSFHRYIMKCSQTRCYEVHNFMQIIFNLTSKFFDLVSAWQILL